MRPVCWWRRCDGDADAAERADASVGDSADDALIFTSAAAAAASNGRSQTTQCRTVTPASRGKNSLRSFTLAQKDREITLLLDESQW